MPAPDLLNAETKLTSLLADFVDSRRTAVGLPDSTALPFYQGIRTDTKQHPCVVFYVAQIEHPWRERIRADFVVTLESDSATLTTTLENSYISMLRNALSDQAQFHAYLLALSEANRQGWWLRKYRITSGGTEIDEETHRRGRYIQGWASFLISEVQPLAA